MKKQLVTTLAACCLLAAFSMPAFAAEYSFDGSNAGLFGTPTSLETIYITTDEPINTDRSKTAAHIPPASFARLPQSLIVGYTAVTGDLYYNEGHLGTLNIPTIGLTVKVYEGTDSAALCNGAGHFAGTGIWDGNVAIAGHNRGVNNHFGKIHTLSAGDTITLTTKLGTRSYEVYSVAKVSANDVSILGASAENIITLVTCVMDQPEYRWCVQARQKMI